MFFAGSSTDTMDAGKLWRARSLMIESSRSSAIVLFFRVTTMGIAIILNGETKGEGDKVGHGVDGRHGGGEDVVTAGNGADTESASGLG